MLHRRDMLAGGAVALLAPGMLRAQGDPLAAALDRIDARALRETVFTLSAFPTRSTDHPNFPAVEQWMVDAFEAIGAEPRPMPFTMPTGKTRHNIVAGNPESGREIILIGAHFDSTSEDPLRLAPGANDNATGIAALLEVHRILAALELDREIVSVAFAGEEQDLVGSLACAEIAARDGWPIALMLNLDMLGVRPARPDAPMVIEFDQGNVIAANDAAARTFGLRAAALAAQHTTLTTTHTDIWGSEYMPFEAQGFPAIGLYDGGVESPHYHSSTDTPDRVDFGRLEQATRLAIAIAGDAAGLGA